MRFELVGGGLAHELHGVAPFDEADAYADQPLEFDRFDLGAILLALAALLGVLVVVELALDAKFGKSPVSEILLEHAQSAAMHIRTIQHVLIALENTQEGGN